MFLFKRTAALAAALLLSGGFAVTSSYASDSNGRTMVAQRGPMGMHGGEFGGGFGGGPGFHGGGPGRGRFGKNGFGGQQQVHAFKHGCHSVCSGFHSHTRCDGSTRSPRYPIHNGVDVAVPMRTPILAIADGVVVRGGRGPSIGGIGLVLRHPPAATGLPTYTYSFYKHLNAPSPLPWGTHVHKGQKVAESGKSGTEGNTHYGSAGFSELHVEIWADANANWPSGHLTDPVSFLRRTHGHTGWFCR